MDIEAHPEIMRYIVLHVVDPVMPGAVLVVYVISVTVIIGSFLSPFSNSIGAFVAVTACLSLPTWIVARHLCTREGRAARWAEAVRIAFGPTCILGLCFVCADSPPSDTAPSTGLSLGLDQDTPPPL